MKISINKLQQFPRILFTITLFSILAACGGSSSSTPAAPPVDPTDASLSNLVPSASSLSPKFASDKTDYTLLTEESTLTVTPTVSQATATVKVNDTATKSGEASQSIDLTVGENIITLIVTAADGKTTKTYKITVTRIDLTTNASLRSLTLSSGTLSPDFSSKVTDYTVTITTETITLTPTVDFNTATVKVNDTATKSGEASQSIDLTVGENTITLIVTAADGKTTKTYKITVTRIDLTTNASLRSLTLSSGTLSPDFSSKVTDYTATITAETITFTPTVDFNTATVKVNDTATKSGEASQSIDLNPGENTITLIVTAANKSTTKTYSIKVKRIANVEFTNPKAADAANHKFGEKVVQLSNGNIVVHAPGYGTDKGAVHFYKPTSNTAVASFYGTNAGDKVGSGGIIALANDNFLIVSPFEDKSITVGGAGSVRLVNGTTGNIIKTITGDSGGDGLGNRGITLLNDNQFVITSSEDRNDGRAVGSVLVIDDKGDTVKALYGNEFDVTRLGDEGATALSNNNFVIVSAEYTYNNQTFAGIVQLVDSKGELIQSITGQGKKAGEVFGADGITPLKNGNFLIATRTHDASDSLTNAGAIELINGSTGAFISRLVGDKKDGYLGYQSGTATTTATTTIKTLANSNYVVMHHTADNDTVTNAGSVRLFSGTDGRQLGETVKGNFENDFEKDSTDTAKIVALSNSNYVVTAAYSDKTLDGNTLTRVGSIRLMNGNTGAEMAIKYGDKANDRLGYGHVIELSNQKYVVSSPSYNLNEGSVMLFNDQGDLEGVVVSSNFGINFIGTHVLTALGNNKFVIVSSLQGSAVQGSISLADANVVESGNIKEIAVIHGDDEQDYLGNGGVTLLNNHNFVFASPRDVVTVNGAKIKNVGSVQAVNGTTGVAKTTDKIVGLKAGDMYFAQMIKPTTGDYYILSQPLADDNDKIDVGKVRLVVPTF